MFKNTNSRRLSQDEIDQAKERILKEYDHLIVRFMKPRRIRDAFLDRYFEAVKARVDMTRFLHAEMNAVQEIFNRETERAVQVSREEEKRKERRKKAAEPGFADRIMAQNLERIAGYPDLDFHPDAATEIRKMAGILKRIDEEFWPPIDDILRKNSATMYSNSRLVLEKGIYELATSRMGSASNRLSVYINILGRFPRDYRALEREGQLYLLNAAHFLHNLLTEISTLLQKNIVADEERFFLEKTSEYVHTVIMDFRLAELKPK